MFTERTITEYAITCDVCGARAEYAPTRPAAQANAAAAGWWHETYWNGLAYVARDMCPACYGMLDLEGGA